MAERWVRQTPGVAGRAPQRSPWGLTPWLPLQPGVGRPDPPSNSQSSVRPALSDPLLCLGHRAGAGGGPHPRKPLPRGAHVSLRYDPGVSPLSRTRTGSRGCGLMPGLRPHLGPRSQASVPLLSPQAKPEAGGSALPDFSPGWCHAPSCEVNTDLLHLRTPLCHPP